MVKKKVENPQFLAVSANLVGNFGTTWLHHHLGAIYPYLPEPEPSKQTTQGWEVSNLPEWRGSGDWNYKTFEPVPGHRWLPLAEERSIRPKMPIDEVEYTGFGRTEWNSWQFAAQLHYSFLENLEHHELWRYDFGTWDLMYQRIGINMFAITGHDILKIGTMPADDEKFLTMEYPEKIGRRKASSPCGIANR